MKITLPNITPGDWLYGKLSGGVISRSTAHPVCEFGEARDLEIDGEVIDANGKAISALPDLLAALADALEKAPRCNPQHPDLLTDAERCPETHPYCCGACAHFYRIRTALTKAGCTIQP